MANGSPAPYIEPAKYKRALPPAHYSLKIESFTALSLLGKDKYDSKVFEAGGYRWSLSLYPNGNKEDNGSKYISLYLSIEERDKLADGKLKVHVNYKLFVYNKSRREYLTIQDAEGAVSSFDHKNTKHGFPRFLSLKKFKKDGYLEGDSCTFGAEVFVIQPAQRRVESFTLTEYPPQRTHTQKIPGWSKLGTRYHSDEFPIAGRQWKLLVDPKGNTDSNARSMSVYLELQHLTGKKKKVYAEFTLRVVNQLNHQHKDKEFKCWLSASKPEGGDADFMPLKDLMNKSGKGFVSNDTLIVEVEFTIISAEPILKRVGV